VKIRTMVMMGLALVIFGLMALSIFGTITWRSIERQVAINDALQNHYEQVQAMAATIDYLTLVHSDIEIIRALARDARALANELNRYDHALSRLATKHLLEIGLIGDQLIENMPLLTTTPTRVDNQEVITLLSRQVRIHHAGSREALSALRDLHDGQLRQQMNTSISALAIVSLGFALMVLVTAFLVQRRLTGPIRQIERAMREFSRGNLDARINLDSGDEFGQLASTFNAMAESRAKYQRDLGERNKELNCLYQVLELTTDSQLDDDQIGEEVARLIPISLQHSDLAVARVILGSDQEHVSPNWTEPIATISRRISVDGQVVGLVEFGYREWPHGTATEEQAFLGEEHDLVNGIALHLGRMIKHRRLNESLARTDRLRAVGELTGGISHDFNNLLTVILGNAELLEENLAGRPDAQLAAMITAAAQRGSELTQRLLAFSRRQALEPRSVDLNRMLPEMHDMLVRSLGENIEINLRLADDLWPALVDPAQLESAILNLCLNARDAMSSGGHLTLETDNIILDADYAADQDELQPGAYVMLAVSDNGAGIEAEDLAHVFEPFYTTKADGTGLGLSMVFGLVKQSQGHIRIYSEPGEGTTVRLYLPRAGEAAEWQDAVPEAFTDANARETILVVEDNELVRNYAAARIRQWGYQVIEAASGGEALQVIRKHPDIDLLFTDVVMPGISGRELVDRALEFKPDLKVLYTSGYTENAIVHHGRLDAGVNLLSKPYRASELRRRIRQTLEQ
jgi:signal transduction histidine kinase/HAMP domain-containing protein